MQQPRPFILLAAVLLTVAGVTLVLWPSMPAQKDNLTAPPRPLIATVSSEAADSVQRQLPRADESLSLGQPDSSVRKEQIFPEKSAAFRFAAGPAGANEAILQRLRKSFPVAVPSNLRMTDIGKLHIQAPLAQYRLPNRNALLNGSGLETAVADGFYYALIENGQSAGSAVIKGASATASPTFSLLPKTATDVENVLDALDHLANSGQIGSSSYEARILLLPRGPETSTGAPIQVIWLTHLDAGGGDWLYMINQTRLPKDMKPGVPYPAKDYLDLTYAKRAAR